jgi:acyl-CoA reductase-like NAD-dependent aldehyde dehydrogenase
MQPDHDARLGEICRLAHAMEERRAEFQEAAALDAGFPVKITGLELDLSVQHLRSMAEEIAWIKGGKPYGTVGAIFPYDAPSVMLARLGGAALLTSNRLLFSFSSQTPRTAELMAEMCRSFRSLIPVVGVDNRRFGRRCIEDVDVRLLFISGASAVGETYRRNRDAFDKIFFAGPGGMPAAVVFPYADAARAAEFIARRAFINGGQYCTTLKKAYIHKSRYNEVRDFVLNHARSFRVGDPFDPKTDIGPIRVERTRHLIARALEECSQARVLAGIVNGETVHPFVLEMDEGEIPDLELFGPFLVLKSFEDADAVVLELTRSRYGFLVAFFGSLRAESRDLLHGHFGMVHDNPAFHFTPMRLPFGGRKSSGWILERCGDQWVERDGAFVYSKELIRSSCQ